MKIAAGREERRAAYRLIHDEYVAAGYLDPQPSGLRIIPHYELPETQTFLLMRGDRACSTFTLIPDNALGFTMEDCYRNEIQRLREDGCRLAEVSGLSVVGSLDRTARGHAMLYTYAAIYLYAVRVQGVTDLCIAINPRHATFYERVLLFEPLGGLRAYESLKNAPCMAKRLHLPSWPKRLRARYVHLPTTSRQASRSEPCGRDRPVCDATSGGPKRLPPRYPLASLFRSLLPMLGAAALPPWLDLATRTFR